MIELTSVSKWYGQHQVLNDCSASIGRGEVVVICGPSGSGKSTLIKTINGLESVQRGQIVVNDIDVTARRSNLAALRSKVGMYFSTSNYFRIFPCGEI